MDCALAGRKRLVCATSAGGVTVGGDSALSPGVAFVDRPSVVVAGRCVVTGGLDFFVAANWSGMGRFSKFALAELAVIASLVAYVRYAHFRYGNAALLAASLAVGALLALIGYRRLVSAANRDICSLPYSSPAV
ncbi:MAG: DUF2157 domain-containing protein [Burkholderiales bacterium]|jgi:hypothetical protein|nr:DUF2157 domain-containing protein [Burkholderiales bacterium]